jgi:hypothetical protein
MRDNRQALPNVWRRIFDPFFTTKPPGGSLKFETTIDERISRKRMTRICDSDVTPSASSCAEGISPAPSLIIHASHLLA